MEENPGQVGVSDSRSFATKEVQIEIVAMALIVTYGDLVNLKETLRRETYEHFLNSASRVVPGRETRAPRRLFAATPSGLRTPLRPHPAPPLRRPAAQSAGIAPGFQARRAVIRQPRA